MTKACDDEFETVTMLMASCHESRGVDAFCLAWIKHERQLRKVVAYLLFQATEGTDKDREEIRKAFMAKQSLSHNSFIGAVRKLTNANVRTLVGDRYKVLKASLDGAYKARQKIFHGQQTGKGLTRRQLVKMTGDIQDWCSLLAESFARQFGYEGFGGRNSLTMSSSEPLRTLVRNQLGDCSAKEFIQKL
jgi:hypothetical protein